MNYISILFNGVPFTKNTVVVSLYLSPNSRDKDLNNNILTYLMEDIQKNKDDSIIILGDFNKTLE